MKAKAVLYVGLFWTFIALWAFFVWESVKIVPWWATPAAVGVVIFAGISRLIYLGAMETMKSEATNGK